MDKQDFRKEGGGGETIAVDASHGFSMSNLVPRPLGLGRASTPQHCPYQLQPESPDFQRTTWALPVRLP